MNKESESERQRVYLIGRVIGYVKFVRLLLELPNFKLHQKLEKKEEKSVKPSFLPCCAHLKVLARELARFKIEPFCQFCSCFSGEDRPTLRSHSDHTGSTEGGGPLWVACVDLSKQAYFSIFNFRMFSQASFCQELKLTRQQFKHGYIIDKKKG
jgi:hypothetical protein